MSAGTALYYSDMLPSESWIEEVARIKLIISDSLVGRIRYLEAIISDPRNIKESIYTPYRRVKVVEKTSNKTIFLGRIEVSDPYYDENYGECLKINAVDYLRELFERKLNSNYSTPLRKRSALISQIITDYAYSGTLTQNIETSGSSDTIGRNYTKCDKTLIQVIEELAQEDFWTEETWEATWRFNNVTYDNNTTEANSAGGTPFNFLEASNHYFYLGQAVNPFLGAEFDLQTMGSYGAQTWSYWSGSSWSPLTISLAYDFTADGTIRWDLPTDWAKVAFSVSFPHSATPPDTTSRYWVRVSVASVTTTATVNQIKCVRGCGYDYYVDDSQVFQYFRRGSKPAGGASANGLTIALNEAEAQSVRAMYYDYSICDQPKEIITRVTVRGKASDGTDQSYTATRSDLETTYKIVKEKIEYVWGADMAPATLLTYCTNRAKALLGIQAGEIIRGECKIVRYPYFGAEKTLVRVGDLVHVHVSPKSINEDFLVLEVKYEEPPGMATIKFVTTVYGRAYSPFELTSVLQGLRTGQDISVATARIQDLIAGSANIADLAVTNAKIGSCSISKLTAGNLQVEGTIAVGGKWKTGDAGTTRIEITPSQIVGYSAANVAQFYLSAVDGKAYAGAGAVALSSAGVTTTGELLRFVVGTTLYARMGAVTADYFQLSSFYGAAIFLMADSDLEIGANTGNVILFSNIGGILLDSSAITRHLDANSTTRDIGAVTQYDEIYCDHINTTGGVYDFYDDLKLIKQIKSKPGDPTKIDIASLPDILKYDRIAYMAKAEQRIDNQYDRRRVKLQQSIDKLRDRGAKYADEDPKEKIKELENRLSKVGADRENELQEWKKRYTYVSGHFIPLDKTVSFLLGCVKQLTEKIEALENRAA